MDPTKNVRNEAPNDERDDEGRSPNEATPPQDAEEIVEPVQRVIKEEDEPPYPRTLPSVLYRQFIEREIAEIRENTRLIVFNGKAVRNAIHHLFLMDANLRYDLWYCRDILFGPPGTLEYCTVRAHNFAHDLLQLAGPLESLSNEQIRNLYLEILAVGETLDEIVRAYRDHSARRCPVCLYYHHRRGQ